MQNDNSSLFWKCPIKFPFLCLTIEVKSEVPDVETRTEIWKLPARFADFPIGKYQKPPTRENLELLKLSL